MKQSIKNKKITVPQVKIDWANALFLWSMVFISLVIIPIYFYHHPLNYQVLGFSIAYLVFCGFGITAGLKTNFYRTNVGTLRQ